MRKDNDGVDILFWVMVYLSVLIVLAVILIGMMSYVMGYNEKMTEIKKEIKKIEVPTKRVFTIELEVNDYVFREWNYNNRSDEVYNYYYNYFRNLDNHTNLERNIFVIIMNKCIKKKYPLHWALPKFYVESYFNPNAVNENYDSIDRGLGQLNSKSFPGYPKLLFFDPEWNTEKSINHMIHLIDTYGSLVMALCGYHQGQKWNKKSIEYTGIIMNHIIKLDRDFNERFIK